MVKTKKKKFIFLEHTADVKFQAFGKTLEDVFKNSAIAMSKAMYEGKVKEIKKLKISVKGNDFESLLYNFLEEFLVLLNSRNFLLSDIKEIKVIKNKRISLKAEVTGDNSESYEIHPDIKAVTYNEMFVKKDKKTNLWTSQVVLDV